MAIAWVHFFLSSRIAIIAVSILFLYFLLLKYGNPEKGFLSGILKSRIYSKVKRIGQKQLADFTWVSIAVFVVLNFFQKDVAFFSATITLLYITILFLLENKSKIKIFNRPLDIMLIAAASAYAAGVFLSSYTGLNKNIILVVPLVHILIRWPQDHFSIIFGTAFIVQFVKNSF
ncbi:MAG: hypothetical protein PHQ54_05765 [Candidatus Omnitrophica bacterium]|nr:hypothetical protein [Candidatus Omnitrophota bacterium]